MNKINESIIEDRVVQIYNKLDSNIADISYNDIEQIIKDNIQIILSNVNDDIMINDKYNNSIVMSIEENKSIIKIDILAVIKEGNMIKIN